MAGALRMWPSFWSCLVKWSVTKSSAARLQVERCTNWHIWDTMWHRYDVWDSQLLVRVSLPVLPHASNSYQSLGPFIRAADYTIRGLCKPRTARINGTKSTFAAYVSHERAFCTSCVRINGSVCGLNKPRLIFPGINHPIMSPVGSICG